MVSRTNSLVQQAESIGNIALGTLGSLTALSLGTAFTAIKNAFLMKRIRWFVKVHSIAVDEGGLLVCIARGDATVGEVAAALTEGNTVGPSDTTQTLAQDNAWVVVPGSVELLTPSDSGGEYHSSGKWLSLTRKAGIPFAEDAGWQMFIFNLDGTALTTGGEVQGLFQGQGMWLRD